MKDDVRIESGKRWEKPEVCITGAGSDSKGWRKDEVVFLRGLSGAHHPRASNGGRAHGQEAKEYR